MTKLKLIVILIGVLAAAGIGFLVFQNTRSVVKETASVDETKGEKGDEWETKGGKGDGSTSSPQADLAVYENPAFGFSLKHPKEFSVSEFDEETGTAILFQDSGANRGFQIFISEFDDLGPITVEMVRKDLPDMVIEQPQTVLIGRKSKIQNPKSKTNPNEQNSNDQNTYGISALIFFSRDESLGRTREAWFIWPEEPTHGNNLFQVTAKAELDEELSRIMATWEFK